MAFFAVMVVAATYYWKVTAVMLLHGIGWCFSSIFELIGSLSLSISGLVVFPLGLVISLLGALACIAIAFAPYILIPLGGLWLESKVFSNDPSGLHGAAFILVGILNIVWIAVLHIILPVRTLKMSNAQAE